MAVDHERPLPVAPERLAAVAKMLHPHSPWPQHALMEEVYTIALLGEQIEATQQVAFFLQEAYDIYNNRFRG